MATWQRRRDAAMNAREWFEEQLRRDENDPEALLEDLLLDINEQIVVAMEEQGLTRAALAERLGVSRAFVTQLLNGKPNLTLKTLIQIAVALGARVRVELAESRPQAAGVPKRRAAGGTVREDAAAYRARGKRRAAGPKRKGSRTK
jgi:transcriptional regulator with XRE-family HTH domain